MTGGNQKFRFKFVANVMVLTVECKQPLENENDQKNIRLTLSKQCSTVSIFWHNSLSNHELNFQKAFKFRLQTTLTLFFCVRFGV